MCTAIHFSANGHYFGRNLDLEHSYDESITVTPRNLPLPFRNANTINCHYAIIGVSTNANGYPLYYDAANEKGVAIAALNFPGNAYYVIKEDKPYTLSPFELIPWVLAQCANVNEAVELLKQTQLSNIPFSDEYPVTDLHWFLCDKTQCFTIEPTPDGLKLYENAVGVLTNNPPFPYHIQNLTNYMALSNQSPVNNFAPNISLKPYSRGMGAIGLPGDLSSASRFIRATFTKLNSVTPETEDAAVNQFFHILGTVSQTEGSVIVDSSFEKTIYTTCCNLTQGVYYYTTYENRQIHRIALDQADINGAELFAVPLDRATSFQNLDLN